MLLRRAVHAAGGRYRIHVTVAVRCSADFAFPKQRVAVFVDGCFWHGCPRHGRKSFNGPNATLWEQKLKRTSDRDERITQAARGAGWVVLRFWECEVLDNPVAIAGLITDAVRAIRN